MRQYPFSSQTMYSSVKMDSQCLFHQLKDQSVLKQAMDEEEKQAEVRLVDLFDVKKRQKASVKLPKTCGQ